MIEDWEEGRPEFDYREYNEIVNRKDAAMFDLLSFELQVYCLHEAYERYEGRSVILQFPGDIYRTDDTIQLTRAELPDYFRAVCNIN